MTQTFVPRRSELGSATDRLSSPRFARADEDRAISAQPRASVVWVEADGRSTYAQCFSATNGNSRGMKAFVNRAAERGWSRLQFLPTDRALPAPGAQPSLMGTASLVGDAPILLRGPSRRFLATPAHSLASVQGNHCLCGVSVTRCGERCAQKKTEARGPPFPMGANR
jgi:hypothetical protein